MLWLGTDMNFADILAENQISVGCRYIENIQVWDQPVDIIFF
jgi:hypothetical protein